MWKYFWKWSARVNRDGINEPTFQVYDETVKITTEEDNHEVSSDEGEIVDENEKNKSQRRDYSADKSP